MNKRSLIIYAIIILAIILSVVIGCRIHFHRHGAQIGYISPDGAPICWSKDSKSVYYKALDNTIKRYNIVTHMTSLIVAKKDIGKYNIFDISPDERYIVTAPIHYTIIIHDLARNTDRFVLKDNSPEAHKGIDIRKIGWLANNNIAVFFIDQLHPPGLVQLINPVSLRIVDSIRIPPHFVHGVNYVDSVYFACDSSGFCYTDNERIVYYNFALRKFVVIKNGYTINDKYLSRYFYIYRFGSGNTPSRNDGKIMITDLTTLKTSPFPLQPMREIEEISPDLQRYYYSDDGINGGEWTELPPRGVYVSPIPKALHDSLPLK